jgi:14-3-3 protein epsilon
VVKQIKDVAYEFDGHLSIDERNLLSIAYKHITNALRTSWRVVDAVERAEAQARPRLVLVQRQRGRIELELSGICKDLMDLLDGRLIRLARSAEETVFYLKM